MGAYGLLNEVLKDFMTVNDREESRFFPPQVALYLVKMACERPDTQERSLSQWDCTEVARQFVSAGHRQSCHTKRGALQKTDWPPFLKAGWRLRPPHDGVRRARRLNLFHDLAGFGPQVRDSQRDRLAHRPHGNDPVHPLGRCVMLRSSSFRSRQGRGRVPCRSGTRSRRSTSDAE